MADNKTLPLTGSGDATLDVATKEVSFSGDSTDVQLIELVAVTGTEGARTLNEISDADGIQVQGAAAENAAVAGNPVLVGGRYDTSVRTLNDGDVGGIALTDSGAVIVGTSGTSLAVNGSVVATLQAGTSNIGTVKVENAALSSIAVNDDGGSLTVDGTVTANAGTGTFAVDGSGVTQPVSASSLPLPTGAATAANQLPDGHNVTIDNAAGASAVNIQDGGNSITVDGTVSVSGTVTVGSHAVTNAGTFAVQASGSVAHDAADSGNPVKVGVKAYNFDGTVPGTAVAENDRANAIGDVYGRQYVETAHPNYWRALGDYGSAQTNATLKAAPGVGLKLYITDVIISNGATAGEIALLDGSGGSKIFSIHPAANGGAAHSFRTPLALTANTLLAVTSVTVTTHDITVSGYIAP